MKREPLTLAALFSVAGICGLPHSALSQTYSIAEIGTFGGRQNIGFAVNNAGQVTGYAYTDLTAAHSSNPHAYLYSRGTLRDLGTPETAQSQGVAISAFGAITGWIEVETTHEAFLYTHGAILKLGTLGGDSSEGVAINNAGQVAGTAQTREGCTLNNPPGCFHAFLYTHGAMQDLGTLGGDSSYTFSMNARGQVTGQSTRRDGSSHAFLYSDGAMTDLGTLGGDFSGGTSINDAGQVAGATTTASGDPRAFLYSNGTMRDLGTLGGRGSSGGAINSRGEVIGLSGTDKGEDHAFIYTHGKMKDLGTLGAGTKVIANAVNDAGEVTGAAFTIGTTAPHAFLYRDGRMIDLNDHIDADSPLKPDVLLLDGVGISDSGYILVLGDNKRSGKSLAYLLKECRHDKDDHGRSHGDDKKYHQDRHRGRHACEEKW